MKYLFFLLIAHSFVFNHIQAQDQINKLKTGAILVRLETNEHLINYYSKTKTLIVARMPGPNIESSLRRPKLAVVSHLCKSNQFNVS